MHQKHPLPLSDSVNNLKKIFGKNSKKNEIILLIIFKFANIYQILKSNLIYLISFTPKYVFILNIFDFKFSRKIFPFMINLSKSIVAK
jgi:hypothetical protein